MNILDTCPECERRIVGILGILYHVPVPSPLSTIPLLALILSFFAHAIALKVFPRLGLLDFPERYGHKRGRIPYPVGIVSVLLFLAFYIVLSPWNIQSGMTALAILFLGITSFIDDRKNLPPLLRIVIQIIIALLIFLGGARIFSFTNPLEGFLGGPIIKLDAPAIQTALFGTLPLLSAIFTVFWIGLTINALNWFDGIPGQVSTLSTIGFLTIGLLSLSSRVNQPGLALLALTLAGISAGCLFFDLQTAKMLIGDTGAMFFGLMLGLLTIYSGGKVATAFLVLGVPLLDLAIVIVRRIAKGKSPLKGDARDEHLHHRLLLKGWRRSSIISLTAGIGTVFGITALFLNTSQKFLAALLLFVLMLALSIYSRPTADADLHLRKTA